MRILLVDDDTSVIQALLATIKTLPGHDIRVATNGEQAIANAASLGGLDLLVTDVVMEPMDGFTLRDELKSRYPNLRTILLSGYDLSDYPEQTKDHPFLAKPLEAGALLAAVEKEIAELPPPPPPEPVVVAVPPPSALARAAAPVAATPQARPVARATAAAQPVAVSKATVAVKPAAVTKAPGVAAVVPRATAGPATGPVASSLPVFMTKPGEFTGQSIGSYEVGNQMSKDEWGTTYAAVQTGINRPVSLHILNAERAADEANRLRFIADARAKAGVQHPSILAVYEAGDNDGRIFYAHEYVDGQNLAQLAAFGHKVDERTALNILRTTAAGAAYLDASQTPHLPVDATSVLLGTDGQPRLANLAVQIAESPTNPPEEIVALGRAMFSVVHTGAGFLEGLRGLLGLMVQAPASGLATWPDVLEGVKSIEPKNIPTHVAEIGAQDRATAAAVEAVRLQKKRELRRNLISMASCVVLAALAIAFVTRNRQRVVATMIHIPAGTYTVGQKKVTLPEFWIDKYEVTIGQYAKFIDYLDAHPGSSRDFDHPRQPKQLQHKPQYWPIYFGQASNGGKVHSAPYTLDSPVVDVTFWDAYAYAKWLGRDLPTEEQWEAAARGPEGSVYPWGNDPDEKKVNSGSDFVKTDPGATGKVDGWNYWSRVDQVSGDRSASGVVGMAGNVSEWTNTWTADNRFPILKGGNFMSADVRLDKRVEDQDGGKGAEHIGFRTVTTNKPSNAE